MQCLEVSPVPAWLRDGPGLLITASPAQAVAGDPLGCPLTQSSCSGRLFWDPCEGHAADAPQGDLVSDKPSELLRSAISPHSGPLPWAPEGPLREGVGTDLGHLYTSQGSGGFL